jgi:iron complex transport system ATP-binding protein
MDDASLIINNLSVGYAERGSRTVVASGLSATVSGGELTCLLGSNGVGKSTLLRTLAGFQPKLKGEIRLTGRPIERFSARELAQTVGVVLTEKAELRELTVHEVVGLGRNPYTGFWGRLRKADETAIDAAIELTGIGHIAHRPVNAISDGERQKTMLAKALAQQTPVIILDEPTAFLDFASKIDIMRLLRRLAHESGKTVFLSTHDLELALQTADSLWLLDREHGLTTGKSAALIDSGIIEDFVRCDGVEFDRNTGVFRIIQ